MKIDIPNRDLVAGLEKGLAVIEAFDAAHPKLTVVDVANATGLTRAAARRYLLTLVKNGYAAFDGRFFTLLPRVLRLGYAYLSSAALAFRVQPVLEQISAITHESSSAAVLDGTEVIYIARSSTGRIMAVDLSVGSRLPAYCTALGRSLLAYVQPSQLDDYFRTVKMAPLTPKTKYDERGVRAALNDVRKLGFALADEELELGLRSIAVPVFRGPGQAEVAVNISVAAARMECDEVIERFLPVLMSARDELRAAV
ncbi:IclR family transcriptional regulator C-terminal domain-containing protein [Bradyrhizobium erythrophlei]|uniref:IclR family transcriptional regulator domain-containing protein n=1 Tax=Bradyrhizobium erythrophlei TaxID=1437360 RepID=UPI0035F07058